MRGKNSGRLEIIGKSLSGTVNCHIVTTAPCVLPIGQCYKTRLSKQCSSYK